MSQQDDRPEDAATEWLSPALYRQLCDAVDAALSAPPDARDALLAARLGSDQRLLAEARALLASHEASPRTFITPAVGAGSDATIVARPDSDATFVGRPDSATMIRRDSCHGDRARLGIAARLPARRRRRGRRHPGDARRLSDPPGAGSNSGTVTLRAPHRPEPSPTADTSPRVPIAHDRAVAAAPESRPAWGPALPIHQPPPLAAARTRRRPRHRPAPPPPSMPVRPAAAGAGPAAAAARRGDARAARRSAAATSARRSPSAAAAGRRPALIGLVVAGLLLLVAGGALWMWRQANVAQQDAEARLAKAEKRFAEVRQLGQRLAEVDHLLAVTPGSGRAHGARGAAAHLDAVPDRSAARLRIDGARAADRGGQGLPPAGGVARRHLGPHARRSRRRHPHPADRREPVELSRSQQRAAGSRRCGRS